jgi:hypothetical protein
MAGRPSWTERDLKGPVHQDESVAACRAELERETPEDLATSRQAGQPPAVARPETVARNFDGQRADGVQTDRLGERRGTAHQSGPRRRDSPY